MQSPLSMLAAKAQVRLHICAGSPEPLLLENRQKPPLNIHVVFFVMQATKAQVSLHICAGSHEPLLLDNALSTKISAGSYFIYNHTNYAY